VEMSDKVLTGRLTITVIDGKDLNEKDFGKQDPYCKLHVGSEKYKTKTHKKGGKTPVWDQAFIFTLKSTKHNELLHIVCYDEDLLSDDCIGRADIPMSALLANRGKGKQYYQIVDKDNFKKIAGYLALKVEWDGTGADDSSDDSKATITLPVKPTYVSATPTYVSPTSTVSPTPTVVSPTPVTQAPITVIQPPVLTPVYQQPVYQQPVYSVYPTYQQPTYQQPTYQQPTYQQPTYQTPVYQPYAQPTYTQYPQPTTTYPTTGYAPPTTTPSYPTTGYAPQAYAPPPQQPGYYYAPR